MGTFSTLLKNESKLNIRDMNMVIFAIIMPFVILSIHGIIYKTKPAFDGADDTFLEQSIRAICAGGLMGLPIMVLEYRERQILKQFHVTPISPVMLLIVEFMIYVIYALISMLTLILVAIVLWGVTFHGNLLALIGSWI